MFEQHSSVFSFGNAASFRYYLPAYLLLDLRTTSAEGVRVLSRKHISDDGEVLRDPLVLVTSEQRVAAVAYLKWIVKYEWDDSACRAAMKALLRWDKSR